MKWDFGKVQVSILAGIMLMLVGGIIGISSGLLWPGNAAMGANIQAIRSGNGSESAGDNVIASTGQPEQRNPAGLGDTAIYGTVGIGTDSPSRPLHLVGNACLFERDQDSAGFIIKRTAANRWVFGADELPSSIFVIKTYPEEQPATVRVAIDTSGKVGIGTTSPTAKLEVDDSVKVSGSINRQPTNPPLFRWLQPGVLATYAVTGSGPLAIAFDGTNMWTANAAGNSVTKILAITQ